MTRGGAARLVVDVDTAGVRLPVARARVVSAATSVLRAERVRDALISVAFVTSREMARINREHLGHAGPTDVISFGFARPTPESPVVGDIYVCPDVARENARQHGAGVREELLRLVVHGTLHVLGWDHPVDAGRTGSRMWKRQEALLARVLRDAAGAAGTAR